jgi:hypothetical protein
MPELSAEDREFVQSGMTQAEWQQMKEEELEVDPWEAAELDENGSYIVTETSHSAWRADEAGTFSTRLVLGSSQGGYHYKVESWNKSNPEIDGEWTSEPFGSEEEAREAGQHREDEYHGIIVEQPDMAPYHPSGMDTIELGNWNLGTDGKETRVIIGQSADGYHYAIETFGVDVDPYAPIAWSEKFDTLEQARDGGEKKELGLADDEMSFSR